MILAYPVRLLCLCLATFFVAHLLRTVGAQECFRDAREILHVRPEHDCFAQRSRFDWVLAAFASEYTYGQLRRIETLPSWKALRDSSSM